MSTSEPAEDSRNHRGPDGSMVDWTRAATFAFADEVDALTALQELGDERRAALEQVSQIMRYLGAAVVAAHDQQGVSVLAIAGHARVSRNTVYAILGENPPEEES